MTRYSSIKISNRKIKNKTERAAAIYLKTKQESSKSPITIRSLSRDFNIPKSSLSDAIVRMRAGKPLLQRGGIRYQNDSIDKEIDNWLDLKIQEYDPPTISQFRLFLTESIKQLNKNVEIKNELISRKYVYNYIKSRNLRIKFPVSTLKEGVMVPRSVAQKFFNNLNYLCDLRKYQNKYIFNMDESWVTYDEHSKGFKVVTKEKDIPFKKYGESQKHFTVVVCISKSGSHLPIRYICPYKTEDLQQLSKYNLDEVDTIFNESGWMNKSMLNSWGENVFLKYINLKRNKNIPVLLLLDGHSSRNNKEFGNLMRSENVDILTFPSNCTNKLQPLDLSIYGIYKRQLRENLRETNRYALLEASEKSLSKALNICNIQSSWEKAGLFGVDQNKTLSRFQDIEEAIPKKQRFSISNQILTSEDCLNQLH